MFTSRWWVAFGAATVATLGFSPSVLGQTETVPVFAQDHRPLQAALLSLLQKYPITITYEDPRYEFSGDLLDLTRKSVPPGELRHVIPRGGVLQATYEVSQEKSTSANVADALQTVVDAQNASPVGGKFAVYRSGETFHVVPSEVRDSNGTWIKQESVLDTPITLSEGPLNGYALIEAIIKKVSAASGQKFWGLSTGPFINELSRYHGEVEAIDEPAREVLMRVLHAISPRFTWMLDYDPAGHAYMLNVLFSAEPPKPPSTAPNVTLQPGAPTPGGSPYKTPKTEE